jgi:hypothetical protein
MFVTALSWFAGWPSASLFAGIVAAVAAIYEGLARLAGGTLDSWRQCTNRGSVLGIQAAGFPGVVGAALIGRPAYTRMLIVDTAIALGLGTRAGALVMFVVRLQRYRPESARRSKYSWKPLVMHFGST